MTAYWTTLSHAGVDFPPGYVPDGLSVKVKGREVKLSPLAEEMAYNLAKKKDTPYIKDPVFDANFMSDFVKQLPDWCRGASFSDVDFSQLFLKVDREKRAKDRMSKARKKALAAERKSLREAKKEKFGYALMNGNKVEFANYLVEPPGLFMGRGQHPMRGRWKPRVSAEDVVLNLDEGAAVPPGRWKEVVHDHNSMWMAKWVDLLTGKEKYVWLHESTPLQQSRNREKYDKALKVGTHLEKIRSRVLRELSSKDLEKRQVATVCYLIDTLGMRVGDEKDEDEADTVGATTLRVEHVKIEGGKIEFNFLGKDSVPWHKVIEQAPAPVLKNLKEFMSKKRPDDQVFHSVDSGDVNGFLSSIVKGATAKVFRTFHATATAENELRSKDVRAQDELDKLYHAKEANLQAAIFCNHKRTPPKNWEESLRKKEEKLAEYRKKGKENMVRKLAMNVEFTKKTRDYNLSTTMKNYIDPRVFKSWSDYVGFDWTKLYTKSLQRKFSWAASSRTRWDQEEEVGTEAVAASG